MTGCHACEVTMSISTRELKFFFQAEDGIRDSPVTGVQTCALPISPYDQDLIFSGLAMEILILSNCWVALTGANRLIN